MLIGLTGGMYVEFWYWMLPPPFCMYIEIGYFTYDVYDIKVVYFLFHEGIVKYNEHKVPMC